MNNPFIVGKVVTDNQFADRKEIIKRLNLDIASKQSIILYGPRRMGKSSLVRELIRLQNESSGMTSIYVDLLKEEKIGRITGSIIHQLTGKLEQTIEFVKNTLKGVNITIKNTTVELGFGKDQELLLSVLDQIEKKSKNSEGILVVFDEFQELVNIAPEIIKPMRSAIQHHSNVCYIFTGSDSKLLDLFTNSDEPFYKFGKTIMLDKPDKEEMAEFLLHQFEKSKLTINRESINFILEKSKNFPYFTQLISQELWIFMKLEKQSQITIDHIEHVLEYILGQEKSHFESLWSKLSPNQRKTLKIILEHEKIFTTKVLSENEISQGSLQQAIKFLTKDMIIWKKNGTITLLDPLFELWIQQRYLN